MVEITSKWKMEAWRFGFCVLCVFWSLALVTTGETFRGMGLFFANILQFLFFMERERQPES